jgi:hypothetical protein
MGEEALAEGRGQFPRVEPSATVECAHPTVGYTETEYMVRGRALTSAMPGELVRDHATKPQFI